MPKTAAPKLPSVTRQPIAALVEPAPVATIAIRDEGVAEEHRWFFMLLVPFAVGATFFAAAIGTGNEYFIGPAIFFAVMCLIFAFIYLALTSESN
jgi:hypothetical protein